MITTINNNHRVFLVTGDFNGSYLCNIEQLEKCCAEITDKDSIKIQHKWNNRFVRCSKKSIVDMLKSLGLNANFQPLRSLKEINAANEAAAKATEYTF